MRLQTRSHQTAFVLNKESRACSGPSTTSTPIPTSTLLGPDLGSLDSQKVRGSGSRLRTRPWSVLVSEPKQTRIVLSGIAKAFPGIYSMLLVQRFLDIGAVLSWSPIKEGL